MNFKPLGKRVLVLRQEQDNITKSGLILPTNNNEKPSIGIIKAISNELLNSSLALNAKVAFKEFKANPITLDGIEYLVLEEADILGIIE